jgi:hypothetical protein
VSHGDIHEEELDDLRENEVPAPWRGIDVQQALLVQACDQLEKVACHPIRGKPIARCDRFPDISGRATAVDQREHKTRGPVDRDPVAGYGVKETRALEQYALRKNRDLFLEDHAFLRAFSLENAAAITRPTITKTRPPLASASGTLRAASRGAALEAAAKTQASEAPSTA